jgi:hypothetical protein
MIAPNVHKLRALRRAGVVGGREGSSGKENKGVNGVETGSFPFFILMPDDEVTCALGSSVSSEFG